MGILEELIRLINEYRPSLSDLPVYIIFGAIVTILLAAIFTRHRWIKFLPGLGLMIYGAYRGIEVWKVFAEPGTLEEAWQAILFFVTGIVSFTLAIILHLYISKRPKKKKAKKPQKKENPKKTKTTNNDVKKNVQSPKEKPVEKPIVNRAEQQTKETKSVDLEKDNFDKTQETKVINLKQKGE